VLTAAEMSADADRFFKRLDRNHDGEIDPDDITYYEEQVAPQLRVDTVVYETRLAGDEVQRHYDDESSSGRFGLLQIPEPVASADTNFDRGVSAQEFRNAALARFQLLDLNHAGRLGLTQLQDIRHAAGNVARKRRNGTSNPAENASSAEYGTPAPSR
jgi:Ca2+-binding EF-hand superfamily protein